MSNISAPSSTNYTLLPRPAHCSSPSPSLDGRSISSDSGDFYDATEINIPKMKPFPLKVDEKHQIYAGPNPLSLNDAQFKEKEISHAVCFLSTEEVDKMKIKTFYQNRNINFYPFPIKDFSVPSTVKDTHLFLKDKVIPLFKTGNVYFHCQGGKGRTGTMLACMMAMINPELPSEEIIKQTRTAIPGAIENTRQETFVMNFHKNHLNLPPTQQLTSEKTFTEPGTAIPGAINEAKRSKRPCSLL
jgi:protein-tyrosine phosphatase